MFWCISPDRPGPSFGRECVLVLVHSPLRCCRVTSTSNPLLVCFFFVGCFFCGVCLLFLSCWLGLLFVLVVLCCGV